jgi:hypothetical protein
MISSVLNVPASAPIHIRLWHVSDDPTQLRPPAGERRREGLDCMEPHKRESG